MPPSGARSLVIVLHGGLGNAQRIASRRSGSALNLNAMADAHGFVVAYLSGTPVARLLGSDKLGWNAGACCGLPAEKQVDDVQYLRESVESLIMAQGIDRRRVFAIGHSNGAMMVQRAMCETTLFAAAVAVSGGLESGASRCPAAQNKRLLAIHGEVDQNVPLAGGRGAKGLSRVAFRSQAETAKVWQESGAAYDLKIVPGADHSTESINTQLQRTESRSLAQTIVKTLGLDTRTAP